MKPKLVIILGPTAVGKSAVSLELAARLDGEIISADSQLVYRGLNIGTAKPSLDDRARVRHHLIDILDPDEEFNAAKYRALAMAAAEDIRRRNKAVFVCGGTGFYIKSLTRGLFPGPQHDSALRKELESELENDGLQALYRRLEQVDPTATAWIHPHDRQRILRALEVYQVTGRRLSEWQETHAFRQKDFTTLKIGLHRERADLYERINRRCEQMLADGLLEEVQGLLAAGYGLDLKPLQSVGYRHMGWVLQGKMPMDRALALMQRDTRRLAKRQLTWFRSDPEIRWHPVDQPEETVSIIREFFEDDREGRS